MENIVDNRKLVDTSVFEKESYRTLHTDCIDSKSSIQSSTPVTLTELKELASAWFIYVTVCGIL